MQVPEEGLKLSVGKKGRKTVFAITTARRLAEKGAKKNFPSSEAVYSAQFHSPHRMGKPRSLPSTVVFILCLLRRPIPTRPAQRAAFHFRRQFLSSDKGKGARDLKTELGLRLERAERRGLS